MRKQSWIVCAAVLVALAFAAPATALEANGVAVSDYATGFPTIPERGVGPIGLAFDGSNRLFVASSGDGWLYRFDRPGPASADRRIGPGPVGGFPHGLAMDAAGRLYLARRDGNDILEIDPNTGAVLRTVAAGLRCPIGLAFDPGSNDLFATAGCDDQVLRITELSSPTPKVEVFATGLPSMDGIAVAPDGTLFVDSNAVIVQVAGTRSSTPGEKTPIIQLAGTDGVAVAPDGSGKARSLIVSRTNGRITRVDLTGSKPDTKDLVTGASRASLAAVDADGCFYADLADRVIRLTNPDGTCGGRLLGGLEPTTPGGSGGDALPDTPAAGCVDTRKFSWRLHHAPGARVTSVDIYVDGKRKVRRRANDIETVSLTKLPQGTFRVRIVARHSDGRHITTSRRYKGCKKGKPRGRRGGGRGGR